jgi:hypothetical protein
VPMDRELSLLLDIAQNERAEADVRFSAAVVLTELGHVKEASEAFSALISSRSVDDEVRTRAAQAVQKIGRGEIPQEIFRVMPAPIDLSDDDDEAEPPPPPRPL